MAFLLNLMSAICVVLHEIEDQMSKVDEKSENYSAFAKKAIELHQHRELLETYTEEMDFRIKCINDEVKRKIEELIGEQKENIANVKHEFEDKAAALSKFEDVEIVLKHFADTGEMLSPSEITNYTNHTIIKYKNMHFSKNNFDANFFFAAASSLYQKYVGTPENNDIYDWAKFLTSKTNKVNLCSLSEIDETIHSLINTEHIFFILDSTSLRVILTNLPKFIDYHFIYILIHDSASQQVFPISSLTENDQKICLKCVDYKPSNHTCQRRCPICLQEGEPFKCFKPYRTKALICIKCNAYCQTPQCYETHQKVCPLPKQPIYDAVLALIRGILEKYSPK